jgi:hypothetical protein
VRRSAAGVVDKDAHRPKFVRRALQRGVHLLAVTDIGSDAQSTNGFGYRRAGFGVALPDRHRRAECGETFGDTAADARSPTGHDGDASGQQDVGRITGHR